MLWMTGLAAPAIYRRGGFVAIDMLEVALPKTRRGRAATGLAADLGAGAGGGAAIRLETCQFGLAVQLPVTPDLFGMGVIRVKLAWMYLSIFVGIVLLIMANIELILRSLITLPGGARELPLIQTRYTVTETE